MFSSPKKVEIKRRIPASEPNILYKNPKAQYINEDAGKIHEYFHLFPEKIDIIFHLAAHARIQPSFKSPLSTLRNNSITTAAICEFARHKGAKVIYAGSSSFYAGVFENPYSFSKWQGEQVCEMFGKIYNLPYVITRFFNVYGQRQPTIGKFATIIGIFERQFKEGKNLTIVGDGEQRRDFTHVQDICSGLIELAFSENQGIYNLGTGINYSINELADIVINFAGHKNIKKTYLPQRPGEARVTLADISKTLKETNWKPKYNLETYLKEKIK